MSSTIKVLFNDDLMMNLILNKQIRQNIVLNVFVQFCSFLSLFNFLFTVLMEIKGKEPGATEYWY